MRDPLRAADLLGRRRDAGNSGWGLASDAVTFIRALGFDQVDLFGFSMGGMIAQVIARRKLDDAALLPRSSCSRSLTPSTNGFAVMISRDARSSMCCSRWAISPTLATPLSAISQIFASLFTASGEEAGLRDPGSFARSWHILMKGAIVAAAEGDVDAARWGKSMAQSLLDRHRA
jgi:pimeloyl-ACP methyl ester carboxylesterase